MRDQMNDGTLALDAAAHAEHAGGQQRSAIGLEHLRPDDEVRDARLVCQRHEQDTLRAAGPLSNQHDAGGFKPAAVAGIHGFGKGLGASFGTFEVLKDIDLAAGAGTVTCIIGPSDSGKSTLLRCLNRLVRRAAARS